MPRVIKKIKITEKLINTNLIEFYNFIEFFVFKLMLTMVMI